MWADSNHSSHGTTLAMDLWQSAGKPGNSSTTTIANSSGQVQNGPQKFLNGYLNMHNSNGTIKTTNSTNNNQTESKT